MRRAPSTRQKMQSVAALTDRQREILSLFAARRQGKEIARQLNIKPDTVWKHMTQARERLGVSSTRDAVTVYLEWELARTLPIELDYQSAGMAERAPLAAVFGHGQARPVEFDPSDDPLDGSGAGLDADGGAGESFGDPTDPGYGAHGQPDGSARSGHPDRDRRLGMARRRERLYAWIGQLGLIGWGGLVGAVMSIIIAVIVVSVIGMIGLFQVIEQFTGQTG